MTSDEALKIATLDGWNAAGYDEVHDALTALAAEVRRLQAALRERHAEAVENAYCEGWQDRETEEHSGKRLISTMNAAWLASEAKARLT